MVESLEEIYARGRTEQSPLAASDVLAFYHAILRARAPGDEMPRPTLPPIEIKPYIPSGETGVAQVPEI